MSTLCLVTEHKIAQMLYIHVQLHFNLTVALWPFQVLRLILLGLGAKPFIHQDESPFRCLWGLSPCCVFHVFNCILSKLFPAHTVQPTVILIPMRWTQNSVCISGDQKQFFLTIIIFLVAAAMLISVHPRNINRQLLFFFPVSLHVRHFVKK